MSVVAEILGVARSNLIKQMQPQTSRSRGRPCRMPPWSKRSRL
jgi:hypothetical protein